MAKKIYDSITVDHSRSSPTKLKLHSLLSTARKNTQKKSPSRRLQETASRVRYQAQFQEQYCDEASEFFAQQKDQKDGAFPLFALPVELRLAVYYELLVTDDRLVVTWRGPRKANKQQKRMYINILLACQACRDEGLGVLYGENVFDFGECRDACHCIEEQSILTRSRGDAQPAHECSGTLQVPHRDSQHRAYPYCSRRVLGSHARASETNTVKAQATAHTTSVAEAVET
jgi:hypothetical protein